MWHDDPHIVWRLSAVCAGLLLAPACSKPAAGGSAVAASSASGHDATPEAGASVLEVWPDASAKQPKDCFVGTWVDSDIERSLAVALGSEVLEARAGRVKAARGSAQYMFSAVDQSDVGKYEFAARNGYSASVVVNGREVTAHVSGVVQGSYKRIAPDRISTDPATHNTFAIRLEGTAVEVPPITFPNAHWQDELSIACGTTRKQIRIEPRSQSGFRVEASRSGP
jgi:hypothetical protein